MGKEVTLDGVTIPIKDLKKQMKEAKKSGKKIIEIETGVYKTLSKLED